MATWADVPKIQAPPRTEDIPVLLDYVKKLADATAKMAKDLEFILNGNVAFDNIKTNGIEAKNIQAEAITTEKLQAGAVVAEKIDVGELSAISANVGKVTAGEIYGNYIATRETGYPKAEMSNTNNLFQASSAPGRFIQMQSLASGIVPAMKFINDSLEAYILPLTGNLRIDTSAGSGDITIQSGQDLRLDAAYNVTFTNWGKLYSFGNGQTLQEALDALSFRITALGG
ncbi:hypothetical protein D3C75_262440 [compost metagenome]